MQSSQSLAQSPGLAEPVPDAALLRHSVNPYVTPPAQGDNEEYKLPKLASLSVIITANVLLQISFFIIVSSSNEYARHLGGSSTFSGVVIGIPTVFSGLALIPMTKYDGGNYKMPLHVSCAASVLGHVLYGLAYRANFLYLILLGRIVNGAAFTMFMYSKRYITDARLVGVRRRTTLASWLVIGQGIGISLGPFAGGLLFRVGFKSDVFNGYTAPGWIMAGIWMAFWVCAATFYEDPPQAEPQGIRLRASREPEAGDAGQHVSGEAHSSDDLRPEPTPELRVWNMTTGQWGVVICMCWFAMTCFFVLGAWEANLPVFGAASPHFHWSPFAAGNFIALGGIAAFPFLLLNILVARRIQDRKLLLAGTGLGAVGLLTFLILLHTDKLSYGSLFACWWAVALGFNLASTVTLSLLSKQLPPQWNKWTSLAIQYSNYTGRVTGAVWGGSGTKVGMSGYAGLELAVVGVGAVLFSSLWRELKAKTG